MEMKRLLTSLFALWFFLIASGSVSYGQTTGALLPFLPPAFTSASGIAASSARLCAFAAGTTTPLAIYSDSALTTTLPNPNTLDSVGRPTTSGGTASAIYIQPRNYKFILYAAGATGSACPLTGTTIWSRDNVYDIGMLQSFDNVQLCSRHAGATASVKIAACIAALPSTGGIADANGIQGASQTWTTDPFSGVTKPVMLLVSGATFTQSVPVTVPANVTLTMSQGAIISVGSGQTLTIGGDMAGSSATSHFSGSGTIRFSGPGRVVLPQWFGAVGDDSTASTTGFNNAALSVATDGGVVDVLPGTYRVTTVNMKGNVYFSGRGVGKSVVKNTSGYAFDYPNATGGHDMGISNLSIYPLTGSSGGIQIDRPASAAIVTHERLSFLDLYLEGTGSDVSAIGMNISMVGTSWFERITVRDFADGVIMDRTTINHWRGSRLAYNRRNLLYTNGIGGGGNGPEYADNMDLIGPSNGSGDGYIVKIDMGGVHIAESLYEIEQGGGAWTGTYMVGLTADGASFQSKGNQWSAGVAGVTLTNSLLIAAGAVNAEFLGDFGSGVPVASIGAVTVSTAYDYRHRFTDCEYGLLLAFNNAVNTVSSAATLFNANVIVKSGWRVLTSIGATSVITEFVGPGPVQISGALFTTAVISTAVTAAAGSGAGTSPPSPVVSTAANGIAGAITFGTGTTPSAGQMVTVTLPQQYPDNNFRIFLNPQNAATAALNIYTANSGNAQSFIVLSVNAPSASQANTAYGFDYFVIHWVVLLPSIALGGLRRKPWIDHPKVSGPSIAALLLIMVSVGIAQSQDRGAGWSRQGVVVPPNIYTSITFEPTLLPPESGSLLFDASLVVWKMYYSGSGGVSYAESLDGIRWRFYQDQLPVVFGCIRSFVVKNAGTYHLYCSPSLPSPDRQIDHYTSVNGVSFTLANSAVIIGNPGGWNPSLLNNNSSGIVVDGVFYLFVEHYPDGIGLFTSTDFATFIPVAQIIPGAHQQGPTVPYFANGKWWMWLGSNDGMLSTQFGIQRWSAPELTGPWTNSGWELRPQTADEGVNTYAAEVIDPAVVEFRGKTYLFYSANVPTPTAPQAYQSIKVAVSDMPISELVKTKGGGNALDSGVGFWVECSGVSPIRSCSIITLDSGALRTIATGAAF